MHGRPRGRHGRPVARSRGVLGAERPTVARRVEDSRRDGSQKSLAAPRIRGATAAGVQTRGGAEAARAFCVCNRAGTARESTHGANVATACCTHGSHVTTACWVLRAFCVCTRAGAARESTHGSRMSPRHAGPAAGADASPAATDMRGQACLCSRGPQQRSRRQGEPRSERPTFAGCGVSIGQVASQRCWLWRSVRARGRAPARARARALRHRRANRRFGRLWQPPGSEGRAWAWQAARLVCARAAAGHGLARTGRAQAAEAADVCCRSIPRIGPSGRPARRCPIRPRKSTRSTAEKSEGSGVSAGDGGSRRGSGRARESAHPTALVGICALDGRNGHDRRPPKSTVLTPGIGSSDGGSCGLRLQESAHRIDKFVRKRPTKVRPNVARA